MTKTEITRADIMPMDAYGRGRRELRRQLIETKRLRRLEIGPCATMHFENFETMLAQVHEMLFVERGGDAQLAGELEAYNPLIPKGRELVATLMFEIEDETRRQRILAGLGGVEHTVVITVGGERVVGVPEADVERTNSEGKASSVHFLHFPFTEAQTAAFRTPGAKVSIAIEHPNYGHAATVPEPTRQALAADFRGTVAAS